jgi:hypothetical protein
MNLLGVADGEQGGLGGPWGLSGATDDAFELGVEIALGGGGGDLPDGGGDEQGAQVGSVTRFVEADENWHERTVSGDLGGVVCEET